MNLRSTPGAPLLCSPLLSLFQKRPPETKQRVAQRRLGLGCMLHFLPHSGQMEGFPVAGICSRQHVRDRTNSSMARGLFKSNDRYSPPFSSSSGACTQTPSDGSATVRLHKKGSLQGDAPQPRSKMKLRARLPHCQVCLKVSSGLVHTYSPKREDMSSFVWLSVRSRLFPLRLIHTPRRQSELQPDWRQTRRGETAHRSPALQQLAVQGCTQNLERICGGTDRILMLITTACIKTHINALSGACVPVCVCVLKHKQLLLHFPQTSQTNP